MTRVANFMVKNGFNVVGVSGGGIRHIKKVLEILNYGAEAYSAIVIAVGGNDLMRGMQPMALVDQLKGIVKEMAEQNPGCICVTSPILPRIPEKMAVLKSGEWFLGIIDEFDNLMAKAGPDHHNWCSDLYVAETTERGTLPRLDLFEADNTHLNARGQALYRELLTFVIDGVNFLQWSERKRFPVGEGFRSVFWSF